MSPEIANMDVAAPVYSKIENKCYLKDFLQNKIFFLHVHVYGDRCDRIIMPQTIETWIMFPYSIFSSKRCSVIQFMNRFPR
jgi:hypothetical protein